jgi:carboxymethylenebutenolidase
MHDNERNSITRRLFTKVLGGALLAVAAVLVAPAGGHANDDPPKKDNGIAETGDSFTSGNAAVQVLRFERPGAVRQPVVLMLHGCDGWAQLDAYKTAARCLVENGYVAVLIRYFDRTKTPDQVAPAQRDAFIRWLKGEAAHEKENTAREHFREWVETVGHAVDYVRTLPNVNPERVGVVGFSLGSYVGVAAAAQGACRIAALVDIFGGLAEEFRKDLQALPPTLILHGENDNVVPVKEAYALIGLLIQKKQVVDCRIYEGVGHGFIPPGKDQPHLGVLMLAKNQTIEFLNKYLRPARVAAR